MPELSANESHNCSNDHFLASSLIAAGFTLVSPQLALAQHTALMELYDALGLATVTEKSRTKKFLLLFPNRLFSCIVSTLYGDCAVLRRSSDMFWDFFWWQRD
jgi:hypothetical protein